MNRCFKELLLHIQEEIIQNPVMTSGAGNAPDFPYICEVYYV